MALPPFADLIVFMALILALSLYGLTASGHFPVEFRPPALRSSAGKLVLWGTMLLAVVLTVGTLAFAWLRLPLYAAIIGGGAMLLAAPILLQPFPDSFVNGRSGLLTFAALALGLSLVARHLMA
jgi:hypothetical protein